MLLSDTEIQKYGIIQNCSVTPYDGKQKWKDILSWGYSAAGYDVRLGKEFKKQTPKTDGIPEIVYIASTNVENYFRFWWELHSGGAMIEPGEMVLAHTEEELHIPIDIVGFVRDKSTLARLGLALQNTVLEPGWKGSVTLEITNHSKSPIFLESAMPIAQIQFERVEGVVQKTYSGRYQNQQGVTTPRGFTL